MPKTLPEISQPPPTRPTLGGDAVSSEPVREMTAVRSDAYRAPFATRDDGPGYPAIEARPPFVLVTHPMRWAIMAGRLIPGLGKLPLVDGSGRIHIDGRGSIHFADARSALEERGWRVVPESWGPGGSYCRKIMTKPSGRLEPTESYIYFSEVCFPGDPEAACDEEAYSVWAESLVTSGRLPRCPPHVLRRMLAEVRETVLDAAQKQGKEPSGAGAVALATLKANEEVLNKALAEYGNQRATPIGGEIASSGVDTEGPR